MNCKHFILLITFGIPVAIDASNQLKSNPSSSPYNQTSTSSTMTPSQAICYGAMNLNPDEICTAQEFSTQPQTHSHSVLMRVANMSRTTKTGQIIHDTEALDGYYKEQHEQLVGRKEKIALLKGAVLGGVGLAVVLKLWSLSRPTSSSSTTK